MSSSKAWIVQSTRRRVGWTLVIAGAAFVAALVVGDSLVAAVIAIVIVIAVGAFIPNRGTTASDADYPSERSRGTPYVVSHIWTVDQKADLSEIVRAFNETGLTFHRKAESSDEVILTSGSQLWTRLFGGYFVDSRRLPIEIHLKTLNGDPGGGWTVQLEIRDRLGVAVRDKALVDRFAQAAGSIREVVDGQLERIGGTGVDPVDSTARKVTP
jgi:hypothetical protein